VRGLANDLGVDDGAVRRAIKIARLPESEREPIDAGASPKPFLGAARACILTGDMEMRLVLGKKTELPAANCGTNCCGFC
jgi:hypothetical protein